MFIFENGQSAGRDGKITETGTASFQMCSWVSVVANVNDQEASGLKRARNCEGQGFRWVFCISNSQILRLCIWVIRLCICFLKHRL